MSSWKQPQQLSPANHLKKIAYGSMAKRRTSIIQDYSPVWERVSCLFYMPSSFSDEGGLKGAYSIFVFLYIVRRLARKRRNDGNPSLDSPVFSHKVHICSINNFPTAAGLASSAAGFACLGKNCISTTRTTSSGTALFFLKKTIQAMTDMTIYTLTLFCTYCISVYTLARVFGVEGELSAIARQGSGSACRSMYGGFVQWIMGQKEDGKDSIAQQVEPDSHWPELRILVLVVGLLCAFQKHTFFFLIWNCRLWVWKQ